MFASKRGRDLDQVQLEYIGEAKLPVLISP